VPPSDEIIALATDLKNRGQRLNPLTPSSCQCGGHIGAINRATNKRRPRSRHGQVICRTAELGRFCSKVSTGASDVALIFRLSSAFHMDMPFGMAFARTILSGNPHTQMLMGAYSRTLVRRKKLLTPNTVFRSHLFVSTFNGRDRYLRRSHQYRRRCAANDLAMTSVVKIDRARISWRNCRRADSRTASGATRVAASPRISARNLLNALKLYARDLLFRV
jgi:hypothetical protein